MIPAKTCEHLTLEMRTLVRRQRGVEYETQTPGGSPALLVAKPGGHVAPHEVQQKTSKPFSAG